MIPQRSISANLGITFVIYILVVASGGLWGVVATYYYFAIEAVMRGRLNGAAGATVLRGYLEGAFGAVFFFVFMMPWGVGASRTGIRLLGQWMDVLTPTRGWQASPGPSQLDCNSSGYL